MEKSEQRILAAQIKGRIADFENKNECFTRGAIAGMLWCLYLIEHDKAYADQRVKALEEAGSLDQDDMERGGCC